MKFMITPPYLLKGDEVGIVAPAKFIPQENYEQILKFIESKGLVPVRGKTTYLESGIFSVTDEERTQDLQQMIDAPNLKAVFCLRGGYGTLRILDKLNFSTFLKTPKWVIGFSDITVLHAAIANIDVESIHGQMPLNFAQSSKGLEVLFETLEGANLAYQLPIHLLNRIGASEARLVGGNVAMICSLLGTPFAFQTQGNILFIEEIGEHLYRFDRMLQHLKLAGALKNLAGLVVGGLTSMEDQSPSFGKTSEEIVWDAVKNYDYPVCFGFPAGHIENNHPLIINRKVRFEVGRSEVKLQF